MEPISPLNQVKFEKTEAEIRLKRFIYLASERPLYQPHSKKVVLPQFLLSNVVSVFEFISQNKEDEILKILETASNNSTARCDAILYILAVCTRNFKDPKNRTLAYEQVLKICKNPKDMFLFVKLSRSINKNFSNGMRRTLHKYYCNMEPMECVRNVIESQSMYGWTHKDIVKMCHFKPDRNSAQELIFIYLMKNLDKAKKFVEENKSSTNIQLLRDILQKIENIHAVKNCEDVEEIVLLIKEHSCKIHHIPTNMLRSRKVWEALIPNLSIPEILPFLMPLHRRQYLSNNSKIFESVNEIFSDKKKCKDCKILPVEVLFHLKVFETGKHLDPEKKKFFDELYQLNQLIGQSYLKHHNPPKNNALVSTLYKLFYNSFINVKATKKRFLITIEMHKGTMKTPLYSYKPVTYVEAVATIILSIFRAEKEGNVVVATFDSQRIVPLAINKNFSFIQTMCQFKETRNRFIMFNDVFDWALENKKPIDVFLNIVFNLNQVHLTPKNLRSQESLVDSLNRYRKTTHLPNTKLITLALGMKGMDIKDESSQVLNICGFNEQVPKIIYAFTKGCFK